jgi:hypothetical protein
MAKQLKPIIDATNNIYGVDVSKTIDVLSFQYLNGRREVVSKLSAMKIEEYFENQEQSADTFLESISGMMETSDE